MHDCQGDLRAKESRWKRERLLIVVYGIVG